MNENDSEKNNRDVTDYINNTRYHGSYLNPNILHIADKIVLQNITSNNSDTHKRIIDNFEYDLNNLMNESLLENITKLLKSYGLPINNTYCSKFKHMMDDESIVYIEPLYYLYSTAYPTYTSIIDIKYPEPLNVNIKVVRSEEE